MLMQLNQSKNISNDLMKLATRINACNAGYDDLIPAEQQAKLLYETMQHDFFNTSPENGHSYGLEDFTINMNQMPAYLYRLTEVIQWRRFADVKQCQGNYILTETTTGSGGQGAFTVSLFITLAGYSELLRVADELDQLLENAGE